MNAARLHKRFRSIGGAIFAAALIVPAIQACSSNDARSSASAEEREMISRAVFAEDRLWLLHLDGSLASLGPDEPRPERVTADGKVLEICNSGHRPTAVVDDGEGQWRVQQHSPAGWVVRASVPSEGDALVALGCKADGDDISLVSDRRLLQVEGVTVRSVSLNQKLTPSLVSGTALAAEDAVWVGFNAGEWGGGLKRIALDGTVTTIERNRSGELCGGPLNTDCDPVNGIVASPSSRSCVVAAIGLVHMMAHGRIVEVCGTDVRRLYFKPLDPQPPHGTLDEGEPSSTIPFFGLARSDKTLWAIGLDGIYRFSGQHGSDFRPLPKFQNKGGYWVSFDIPGIALVMTDVNQRASMSGAVPIMAVR